MDLLVDEVTSLAFPPGFAVTLPLDAGTVVRTRGVLAVDLVAGFPFPSLLAPAGAADTLPVSRAIRNATVRFRDVALRALPVLFAVAQPASVLAVTGAQHGAYAWNGKEHVVTLAGSKSLRFVSWADVNL